jgi:thioredoxin-dependent peroxiredoxin
MLGTQLLSSRGSGDQQGHHVDVHRRIDVTVVSSARRLTAGDRAPTFTLPSSDGSRVSLAALRGQRVVVYFYPADDTPGCTTEACDFDQLLSAFNQSSVQVLGISPDSIESHQRFVEKFHLRFPLLSDPNHKVMTTYGAYGEKQLYGRTVTGVIRSTFVISPRGTIDHAFYGVKATGHAARVLSSLAT